MYIQRHHGMVLIFVCATPSIYEHSDLPEIVGSYNNCALWPSWDWTYRWSSILKAWRPSHVDWEYNHPPSRDCGKYPRSPCMYKLRCSSVLGWPKDLVTVLHIYTHGYTVPILGWSSSYLCAYIYGPLASKYLRNPGILCPSRDGPKGAYVHLHTHIHPYMWTPLSEYPWNPDILCPPQDGPKVSNSFLSSPPCLWPVCPLLLQIIIIVTWDLRQLCYWGFAITSDVNRHYIYPTYVYLCTITSRV